MTHSALLFVSSDLLIWTFLCAQFQSPVTIVISLLFLINLDSILKQEDDRDFNVYIHLMYLTDYQIMQTFEQNSNAK